MKPAIPERPSRATKRATLVRSYVTALSILAFAGVSALFASDFIDASFAGRPMPKDLVLHALPYLPWVSWVADGVVLSAMLVALIHNVRNSPKRIPAAITMYGIMYTIRSAIIVLTPLATPHPPTDRYGVLPPQLGMFPSGHSGNVLLCYLLIDGRTSPRVKRFALAIAFTEWVALLFSRGHYSIDIIGGLLLAYFVYAEWTGGRMFAHLRRATEMDA